MVAAGRRGIGGPAVLGDPHGETREREPDHEDRRHDLEETAPRLPADPSELLASCAGPGQLLAPLLLGDHGTEV
jgi:hypothetical protein